MKYLSLGINVVLALLVANLYFRSSCCVDNQSDGVLNQQNPLSLDSSDSLGTTQSSASFLFVNTDTIFEKFLLVKEFQDKMAEKKLKLEGKHEQELKVLEKDFIDFQEKVEKRLFTEESFSLEQQRLANMEQQVMENQQRYQQEFMEMEMGYQDSIRMAIESYISANYIQKGVDYVVATNKNSDVLFGNPNRDITAEVVSGINQWYQSKAPAK